MTSCFLSHWSHYFLFRVSCHPIGGLDQTPDVGLQPPESACGSERGGAGGADPPAHLQDPAAGECPAPLQGPQVRPTTAGTS